MVSTRHNIARLRQLFAPIGATTFVGLLLGCQHVDETALQNISDAPTSAAQVRLVERDVESPEVFDIRAAGLWDGAPTLGGIWVAHPDLKDPIRVVIRNLATKKFVIGGINDHNPAPSVCGRQSKEVLEFSDFINRNLFFQPVCFFVIGTS